MNRFVKAFFYSVYTNFYILLYMTAVKYTVFC